MRRTPSREDEQRQRVPRPHSSQRNAPPRIPRRPSFEYHNDEHPEIPKVRRASLRIEESNIPSSTPVHRAPRTSSIARYPRVQRPPEDDFHTEFPVRDTSMIVQQRRRKVHEPPPLAQHRSRRRNRRPQTMLMYLHNLSHNQNFILVGTMMLVALILLPIVITAVINTLHPTTKTLSPTGASTTNQPPFISAPTPDPRELIIMPGDTDHPAPAVFATAAYLLDADTGATLYAHNPFMRLPMLSTTKLMTAILAIEQGNPDQNITVNDAMERDISQLSADSALFGVKKGETYSLRDLLYGLLHVSGNDAAVVIADAIGGNLQHFVAMMNQRAGQLGLYDTHFMDPHGLLMAEHYSSAHDLAFLGRYAMSLPLFRQISGTQQYHITNDGRHQDHLVINGNQFLWWYPGVDGGKTGWDGDANFVQVISCTRNHHHLIGVVIHTIDWWTDMRDLMNWGFDSFNWISPYDVDFQHPIPYDNQWNYFSRDKKELTIPTANGGHYYIYTGYSVSGSIMTYFDKGGGLKKFGYPTALPVASTDSVISQRFEHATIQCDTGTKQCTTV